MAMIVRQFLPVGLRAVGLVLCWTSSIHAAHMNRVHSLATWNASVEQMKLSEHWDQATPAPLYPPSFNMGSITWKQATATYGIVKHGRKEGVDMAEDIDTWDCDKLHDYMGKLQKRYKKIKFEAGYQQYSASKTNARLASLQPVDDDWKTDDDKYLVIDKHFDADKLSEELHLVVMETLRVTEKYGLKCGASDEGCFDYGTELLDNFAKLMPMKKEVEGLVNEAGWLNGEAEMRLATPEQKETAKLRKDAAFAKAKALFEFEKEVTAGVMIKAAACGTRPPLGPWGTPQDGCDLKPEDPIMKALLTDDPQEFIRRWRAEIAKTAGIEEEYVHVDISQCLGKHGRPTLPPNFFKDMKPPSTPPKKAS